MTTETGSTLKLVSTEHTEIIEYCVDTDALEEDSTKTILNNTFDDDKEVKEDEKEFPDTTSTADNSAIGLDAQRTSSDNSQVEYNETAEHKTDTDITCNVEPVDKHERSVSSNSESIIIDEKETVEIDFKSDENHDEKEHVAELNLTSAVIVQPVSSVSVRSETNDGMTEQITSQQCNVQTTGENKSIKDNTASLNKDTDIEFYPLSVDEHRNCCYRCWYNETCNDCIIGLIDRIPDRCLCPCLLNCYRCLQIVLCCDWSWSVKLIYLDIGSEHCVGTVLHLNAVGKQKLKNSTREWNRTLCKYVFGYMVIRINAVSKPKLWKYQHIIEAVPCEIVSSGLWWCMYPSQHST